MLVVKYTLKLRLISFIKEYVDYPNSSRRGMSYYNDLLDWYGGLPCEFAKYEHLVSFVEALGFKHVRGIEASSLGCHELVFQRVSP